MTLNINGTIENVLMVDDIVDISDFSNLVEKYMGQEASNELMKYVSSLYEEINLLEEVIDSLDSQLAELDC